jgi:hypothetical protein
MPLWFAQLGAHGTFPRENITLELIPNSHRVQARHSNRFDYTQMKLEHSSLLPSSIRTLLQLDIDIEYVL